MVVGEFVVVETEEAQEGDVEIADVGFAFDGGHAEVVGGADSVTGVAAATGEPHRHGVRIMVATVSRSAADTVVGGATKLAAPDDERAVQEASLFEVGDERGDGLIHAAHEVAMGTLDVVVAVPGAVVELHEAHAFFDELAGEQAFAAKGIGGVITNAVEFLGLGVFLGEVERLGHLHLHAECEFVVVHARGEFIVAGMLRGVRGVELRDEVEVLALTCFADAGRRCEIQNGRAFRAQRRALEARGQVAVAPVRRTSLRIAYLGQHDEAGQVPIERTEAVVHPRADTGIASEAVAAVHLIHRGRMVHAVHGATTEETKVIRDLGEVRPVVRHVRAALAGLDELEGTLHVVALAALKRGDLLAFADELLEMQLFQRGLGVEGVDVRRPAFHHEEDDVLRLRLREVALLRCERMFLRLLGEQGAERDTAEASAQAIDELAARWRMQSAGSGAGEEGFNRHKQTRWN